MYHIGLRFELTIPSIKDKRQESRNCQNLINFEINKEHFSNLFFFLLNIPFKQMHIVVILLLIAAATTHVKNPTFKYFIIKKYNKENYTFIHFEFFL